MEIKTTESKCNVGQALYGADKEDFNPEAIREGIKVEEEHADIIPWLKEYAAANRGEFPPDEEIFARIAEAHLKESPDYYKKLAKMENKNAKPSDIEIATAYENAAKSGLKGNKAFATAAFNLGISTDEVLNARERMLNPVTPEARRNEGARLYGSRKNSDIDDEVAELEDELMDLNREHARASSDNDKQELARQIEEVKKRLKGLKRYK